MFDIKLSGHSRVVGLSKIHHAIVEFPPTGRFSQTPEELVERSVSVMPMVALFEHFHFVGGAELTFMNWRYVGDWWVEKISSLMIISGTWEFYSERNYRGERWTYGPGLYDEITTRIESFRCRNTLR